MGGNATEFNVWCGKVKVKVKEIEPHVLEVEDWNKVF